MVRLVGDQQDATDREAIYRAARMDSELLELLLAQGREEEAPALLNAPSADLTRRADRLVAAGLEARAVAIVNAHPSVFDYRSDDTRIWLARHGAADMDAVEERSAKLHSFVGSGNVGHGEELHLAAERLGRLEHVLPLAVAAAAETARPAIARELYERIAADLRARGTKPAREELVAIHQRLASMDAT